MCIRTISHFLLPVTHGVPVYRFQHSVGFPAAFLHNIGIRDTQGVTNGSGIVPEVMETEMLYICPCEHSLKHDGNRVGIEGGNMSYFTNPVGNKRGSADVPVGAAGLRSLQVPFFVCSKDKGVVDVYHISLYITQSKSVYFAATHHTESPKEHRDFKFRISYGIHQRLYLVVRGDIELWTYFCGIEVLRVKSGPITDDMRP